MIILVNLQITISDLGLYSKELSERCIMGLANSVCIVTGGGSGIGRSTAIQLASEGATLILVGRTKSKVEAVKNEIETLGGLAKAFVLDVSDHDEVFKCVREVLRMFDKIDVLVNNAGHNSVQRNVLTTTPEEMRSVINSNLIGTMFFSQAVIPSMLKAKKGTIINVSSLAALDPVPIGGMAYSAAKSAVVNFTEFLNNEFGDTNIRASVVIPGEVNTPILDKRPIPPDADARAIMVDAEDVAQSIRLIAGLSQNSLISELIITPTLKRDSSKEVPKM